MKAEEYNALLKLPGYIGMSYEEITDSFNSCPTPETREAALAHLLSRRGLDPSKRIAVGKYWDSGAGRFYVFHQSEDGQLITTDDFLEY